MKKLLTTLPEPERLAIEWRGQGFTYPMIARDIGYPVETVKNWFKRRGKLHQIYLAYIQDRNTKIQKYTATKLNETTDNIVNLDRKLEQAYKWHMANAYIGRLRTKDIQIAAKLKSLILGQPLYFTKYAEKPLPESEAQKKVVVLDKIIKTMLEVWEPHLKEKMKTEFASMEGLAGYL